MLRLRIVGGLIGGIVLLAGCGGSTMLSHSSVTAVAIEVPAGLKRFHFTGTRQSFVVPAGVKKLTITAMGARGGGGTSGAAAGGRGGLVKATISVTPGEKLGIFVGGADGGFNGGGRSGVGIEGGGDASDVRQGGDELTER
ncbi:MAG: hypothetical protein WB810_15245, partial [Candidatus Cybelea sp.]